MTPDELRSAQKLTMANPERLRLLARMLTHPAGRSTAADLVPQPVLGDLPTDELRRGVRDVLTVEVADVEQDLEAMAAVGLVAAVGPFSELMGPDVPLYRVSSRGIAGFGSAALAAPRHPGDATLDVHDHDALLARLIDTLSAGFAANAGAGTVDRLVRECYSALSGQIGSFGALPALTAWLATDRLAATTEVTHGSAHDVLFVCVHNTGRSQIAAAVTRRLAGDRVRVRTAGSRPAVEPDPMTETVLARRDLDGLIEFPRELTDDIVRASGVIVTMGCGDACPVYPGRRYLDWPLDDPAGRPVEEIEQIVDDITARVRALLAEIDAAEASGRDSESEATEAVPAGVGLAQVELARVGGAQDGPAADGDDAEEPPAWLPPGWWTRLARRPWSAVATVLGAKGQRRAR